LCRVKGQRIQSIDTKAVAWSSWTYQTYTPYEIVSRDYRLCVSHRHRRNGSHILSLHSGWLLLLLYLRYIHAYVRVFIHPSVYLSIIYLSIRSFIHPFTYSFIHSFIHSITRLFIHLQHDAQMYDHFFSHTFSRRFWLPTLYIPAWNFGNCQFLWRKEVRFTLECVRSKAKFSCQKCHVIIYLFIFSLACSSMPYMYI
jgi:hypothetical protein